MANEKGQTTQWPMKKDKRSTKHAYKTKDRVTRTPLKTGGELVSNPIAYIKSIQYV